MMKRKGGKEKVRGELHVTVDLDGIFCVAFGVTGFRFREGPNCGRSAAHGHFVEVTRALLQPSA